jgi:hypothetical protein
MTTPTGRDKADAVWRRALDAWSRAGGDSIYDRAAARERAADQRRQDRAEMAEARRHTRGPAARTAVHTRHTDAGAAVAPVNQEGASP